MRPVMVVVIEPDRESGKAFVIRLVQTRVSPLAKRGLDEGLRLAVWLGMSGWRQLMVGADLSQGVAEESGVGIGVGAVGHHSLDMDAEIPEENGGGKKETGRLSAVVRSANLGERRTRAVIDCDVEILPATTPAEPEPVDRAERARHRAECGRAS